MNKELVETRLKSLETLVKSQESQIKVLEDQVRLSRDIEDIEKLQRAYGYYLEHWMTQEILDCFSDSPECELDWMEGKWLGKAGVKRYFEAVRAAMKDQRYMHQLMQVSGVIDVSPDGKRGKGRWYGFGGAFRPENPKKEHELINGTYENEYIKEDGRWKILKLSWTAHYSITITSRWESPEMRGEHVLAEGIKFGPDIPYDSDPRWLSGYTRPFHFKHPVTGRKTSEGKYNAKLRGSPGK